MTTQTKSKTGNAKPAKSKLSVVAFEDSMLEQVFELYELVFGKESADGYRRRWDWSQKRNLFPELTKRWVLLTGTGEVKGFLATIPFQYEIDGNIEIAHTTCDFMVHPDTRFHGIKLMKQFFKECENSISADDVDATIELTRWLGAKDVAGMPNYTRALDMRSMQRGPLRKVPTIFFRPTNPFFKLYERIRFPRYKSGIKVEGVKEFDERFQRLFERGRVPGRVSLVRDLNYLKWRYGAGSPQATRQIGVVTASDGELEGFVVFQRSLRSDMARRGHVYEMHATGERADEVAEALINFAIDELSKSGTWFLTVRQVPTQFSISEKVLKSRGFVKGAEHRLLVRLREDEKLNPAYEESNWCYMYADSEASHGVS